MQGIDRSCFGCDAWKSIVSQDVGREAVPVNRPSLSTQISNYLWLEKNYQPPPKSASLNKKQQKTSAFPS